MCDAWKLVLPVDPSTLPTAQQKGAMVREVCGHHIVQHYTKTKVAKAGKRLLAEVHKAMEGQPRVDNHEGVWFVRASFVYKPKSLTKKMLGQFKTTRPDGDNMLKLLMDVITQSGYFWNDDSQVQINGIYRHYVDTLDDEPFVEIFISRD